MPTLYIRNFDNTEWVEIGGTPGGGLPPSALYGVPYVTMGNSGVTTAERALTAGIGILIADGGPNASVVVSLDQGIAATWTELHTFNLGLTIAAGQAITMGDDAWIGLGAAAGRIVFDDQATDEINFLACNVGIGASSPFAAKLDIVKVDTDDAIAINLAVSADTDGDDVYGIYNTIDTGTGETASDRNAYGVYNDLTVNALADGGVPRGICVFNKITQTTDGSSGKNSLAYGMRQDFYQDSDYSVAMGIINYIQSHTANNSVLYMIRNDWAGGYFSGDNSRLRGLYNNLLADGEGQTIAGVYNSLSSAGGGARTYYGVFNKFYSTHADQKFYGLWVEDNAGYSTAGTHYGVYIDLDDPHVTNYSIWIEAGSGISYFGSYVGILTNDPTAALDINSDILRLRTAKTPASAGAAGNQGDICWDADFLYVCTAANTWKRAAIATW